jgi:hypothetical protein
LEVLQYAHENGCPRDESTCSSAATRGHMEVFQYAHENGFSFSSPSRGNHGGLPVAGPPSVGSAGSGMGATASIFGSSTPNNNKVQATKMNENMAINGFKERTGDNLTGPQCASATKIRNLSLDTNNATDQESTAPTHAGTVLQETKFPAQSAVSTSIHNPLNAAAQEPLKKIMIYLPSDTSDDEDSVSSLYPATKRLRLESEVSDEEIHECAEKVCNNIKSDEILVEQIIACIEAKLGVEKFSKEKEHFVLLRLMQLARAKKAHH